MKVSHKTFCYSKEEFVSNPKTGYFEPDKVLKHVYENVNDYNDAVAKFLESISYNFIGMAGDRAYDALGGRVGGVTIWYRLS